MISPSNLGANILLLYILLNLGAIAAEEFCASTDVAQCAGNNGNRSLDESDEKAHCESQSDSDALCSRWAVAGECEVNPNYMLVECSKSCCEQRNAVSSCDPYTDADETCMERALSGECQSNSLFMRRACLKSCCRAGSPNGNRSSPAPFKSVVTDPVVVDGCESYKDEDRKCGNKAAAGECVSNPEFMNRRCAHTCCQALLIASNTQYDCDLYQDTSGDCANKAAVGECQSNPEFMMNSCSRSCCQVASNPALLSQTALGCDSYQDESNDCASKGKCDDNLHHMLEFCQKTCCLETGIDLGIKQVFGVEPTEHRRSLQKLVDSYIYLRDELPGVECVNQNEYCAFWAAIGECNSKQTHVFMEESCTLACKVCK